MGREIFLKRRMDKINRSKIISEYFSAAARTSIMLLEPGFYTFFMKFMRTIEFYSRILPAFLANCTL